MVTVDPRGGGVVRVHPVAGGPAAAHLLTQHKIWVGCTIRVFVVAGRLDNSVPGPSPWGGGGSQGGWAVFFGVA